MKRSTIALCFLAAMFVATGVVPGQQPSGPLTEKSVEETPDEPLVPMGTPDPAQADDLRASKSVTIPAAAFINSARSNSSGQQFRQRVCLWSWWREGRVDACPVYLPKGAKVTNFLAYIYDNNRNATIYLTMRRVRNLTGVSDPIASVSSTAGASTVIQAPGNNTISNGSVDDLYSYWVRCHLYTEDTRIYAVKIFYDE